MPIGQTPSKQNVTFLYVGVQSQSKGAIVILKCMHTYVYVLKGFYDGGSLSKLTRIVQASLNDFTGDSGEAVFPKPLLTTWFWGEAIECMSLFQCDF